MPENPAIMVHLVGYFGLLLSANGLVMQTPACLMPYQPVGCSASASCSRAAAVPELPMLLHGADPHARFLGVTPLSHAHWAAWWVQPKQHRESVHCTAWCCWGGWVGAWEPCFLLCFLPVHGRPCSMCAWCMHNNAPCMQFLGRAFKSRHGFLRNP